MCRCGFTMDLPDCCGSTPLMDALHAGHVQIAETLIKTYKVDNSIQWISNKTSFEMK